MGAAGTDTALETADIALMSDDLSKLPYLYELANDANGVIRQNIWPVWRSRLGSRLLCRSATFPSGCCAGRRRRHDDGRDRQRDAALADPAGERRRLDIAGANVRDSLAVIQRLVLVELVREQLFCGALCLREVENRPDTSRQPGTQRRSARQ